MVECISVYQHQKEGIHVAAATYKEASETDHEVTKLYYFVLPNDITTSK